MRYGPVHFDSRTLDWLAAALRSGEASRHALARGLCGRGNRREARGRPRFSAAAKAPHALAERVGLRLPPARGGPGPAAARPVPDGDVPDTGVARGLGEPGPVTPGPVGDDGDGGLWEATVARHYPPEWARPPGGQVRHWIRPERHGLPGAAGTVTVPAPGTAGGRRSTTWTAVRWERPPDSTTAPGTWAGPGGNTDAPATPTGGSAAESLAWDGRGWTAWGRTRR